MKHDRALWTLNDTEKRLLEAAPEMLEALKAIDLFYVFFDSIVPPDRANGARQALNMVKDAIAKAEGH